MMKNKEKQTRMKRSFRLIPVFLLVSMVSFGQLTGVKTIPGDYKNIATAITALNTSGVGPGGVIFDVAAGHTEAFSNLTDGLLTATGTAANPIVFRKSGTGANPLVTAALGGTGNFDYIICLAGSDYVTFDGIDVEDNLLNTTATTRMEFGFAFFKSSGADGAQHNTLKNGTISLLYNTNAFGITMDNRLWSNPAVAGPTVTAVSGTNSWNDFQNMTFNNCYGGINLTGFADVSPFAFYDQDNTIGVNGGNTFIYTGLAGTTGISYGVNMIYQNGLVIANNTFTGSLSMTTGRYYAMNLLDAHNADLDVFNNTLSISFTGAGHFYGFYINGELTSSIGSTNTVNFYNNQVINNTFPTHTSGNVVYTYVTVSALYLNIYGNLISNNTIGSATANSTGLVYYTYYRSNPAVQQRGAINIYNNTITNNTRSSAAATVSSLTYFLYTTGQTQTLNMYGNVIDNNTAVAGNSYGLITAHIGSNKNIYDNQITNISGRIASLRGIYNANGIGNTYIYRNRIQNLSSDANPNVIAPTVYHVSGIQQSTGNNTYYYNNYISQLYAPFAASPSAVTGITVYGLNNNYTGLYNNTIYLDGTSVNEGFGARGIYAETGVQLDLRNNIVIVKSIPVGTYGCNAAYARNSSTLSTYQQVSNNNVFYAGDPGPHNLIYLVTNADSVQTLAEYQALVAPRDAQSVSEIPPFLNVATSPYDLHLAGTALTQCESGGTIISAPISIISDFDNDPRYPNAGYPDNPLAPATAPDIGADEFAGLHVDNDGPVISYTPFINTSVMGARVLVATITDPAGVPVSGPGLPVVYWRINSGSWNTATATWTGGSNYSFTFGAGALLNDMVYYYVAAQDMMAVPNVAVRPAFGASGFSANPPACATLPLEPDAYLIVGTLSGIYTVGTGKDYATLTDALTDLNVKEVVGPVTFELWDAQYSASETFPLTINDYLGASQTNTVTIQPKPGVDAHITGNSATGILHLNGCRYVVIDGSNLSEAGGNLTWENTNTATGSYAIGLLNNDYTGASNCTIKGCTIRSSSQLTNSTYGIYLSPSGGGYNNIVIDNNVICSARYGIQFSGQWNRKAVNGQITNNVIGSTILADEVKYQGIFVLDASGTLIEGNEIIGASSGNTGQAGIYLSTGADNTVIKGNVIHRIQSSATNSNCTGINVATTSAETPTKIINNLIYNIKAGAYPSGINISSAGNVSVQHNTISLTDTTFLTTNTTSHYSACLVAGSSSTLLDVRNNIFKNIQQCVNAANVNPKTYAVYSGAAASAYTFIDYNDYYVNAVVPASGLAGRIGFLGSARNTLADWKTATGQDLASQNVDPLFPAYGNLHTAVPALNNAGIYLPAVTTDFNGFIRSNPPDVGAYEFNLPVNPFNTLAATAVGQTSATLNGEVNTNGEVVGLSFEYGPTTSYGNTLTAVPSTLRSLATQPFSAGLTGLPPNTIIHYRAKGVSTTSNQTVYGQDMTFDPVPQPTINGTQAVCQGTADVIYYTETGKANYQWMVSQGGTVTFGGTSASSFVMVTWHGSGAQSVSVNYQNTNGIPGPSPAVMQVNVTPSVPVSVTIVATAVNVCPGTLVGFTATPVNGGLNPSFQWQVNSINAGANSSTFEYTPANGDVVTCVLTSSEQCPAGNPATSNAITLAVNPLLPVSVSIAASATQVCAGTQVVMTATPVNGGSNPTFQWKVNGANVGTNSPSYAYIPANGDAVTCLLTSGEPCTTGNPATSNAVTMTVNPLLPVSISIAASANPVTAGTAVTFTATPVNGGINPVYQWKVNGVNAGTNNATYTYVPVNGDAVTCILTSSEQCVTGSPATSNTISMAVNPAVPVNTSATGTIGSGESNCYNASQTITVAGEGNMFVVQNGGNATMIAGQNILYLPGTMVEPGGYMHGWITTDNQYCGSLPPAMVATLTGTEDQEQSEEIAFRIYPNPTSGAFTLDWAGTEATGKINVSIFDMRGTRIFRHELPGEAKHHLSLAGKPAGIYFVKVVSNGVVATIKLIIRQ